VTDTLFTTHAISQQISGINHIGHCHSTSHLDYTVLPFFQAEHT